MNAFVKLLEIMKQSGEKPPLFGAFHIMSLIIITAVTIILCKKMKSPTEESVRRFLLAVSLAALFLEVYKQIVYSFDIVNGRAIFSYKWHVFPWQFCSTPMFAGLAAALIKNRVIHRMLVCYLATYGLAAGVLISLFPASAFSSIFGINIQTMFCHGSMVTVGVFLLRCGYVKREARNLYLAFFPFVLGVAVALLLNRAAYLRGIPEGQVFNMYFISPYFKDDIPILEPLKRLLPPFLFQSAYLLIFTLLASAALFLFGKRKPTL